MNTRKNNNLYKKTILGLLVSLMLLLGTIIPTQAQSISVVPDTPLFPELTWENLGEESQSLVLANEEIALSGIKYAAYQQINLDAESSNELLEYYATAYLAQSSWQEVATTLSFDRHTTIYFHPDGYFLTVVFQSCEAKPQLACLVIWQSEQTSIVPEISSEPGPVLAIEPASNFNKTLPANGATNLDYASITIKWDAYTGGNLNRYRYCLDLTNNNTCDDSGNWTNAWGNTSITLTSLLPNTTYYWQVQAVLNDNTKIDANSGTWWSFSTKVATPPSSFAKLLPADGAVSQSITPTFTWGTSANATSYSYCIDTTNNDICDNNWTSVGSSVYITLLSGITPNTTYYWQVRSTNLGGTIYADGGWKSFQTGAPLVNDFIDSATTISGAPFTETINTIPATMDSGTSNSCSTGSGYSSVWYKYAPASSGHFYIDTMGSTYDTFITVWLKSGSAITYVTCNDDSSGTKQSSLNLSATAGTTYYFQIAQKNPNTAPTQTPGGTLQVSARSFLDVFGNNPFWPYIETLYDVGITGGCATSPDLLYCPYGTVTRAEMAIFLLRGIHGSSYTPPAVGSDTGFTDVPVTHWAAAWIKQLAAEGITGGCGVGLYCPDVTVTRDQMAVFLLRGEYGSAYVPPAVGTDTGFDDVPVTHWAAAWIKQLAAEGITSGCSAGHYCPGDAVTRAQMAVFLVRTFGLP